MRKSWISRLKGSFLAKNLAASVIPGLKKPFLRQVCVTSGGVILPVNTVIADRLCG
ncbi:hypothetical protein QUA70_02755 [Microcoleus sp. LAD1_D5]|uniref:hypothetical protein n=1 Tax=unclassified Microcoleus TaxID=2642155 RepID=UPI002FD1A283